MSSHDTNSTTSLESKRNGGVVRYNCTKSCSNRSVRLIIAICYDHLQISQKHMQNTVALLYPTTGLNAFCPLFTLWQVTIFTCQLLSCVITLQKMPIH